MLNLTPDAFFDGFRASFGKLTQPQVDGLNRLLTFLHSETRLTDPRHIAYALATVYHETAFTFQPIREYGTNGYFIRNYFDDPKRRKALGNQSAADAVNFCGRGYVQLTGRRNYELFARLLSLPLVTEPEEAQEPAVAWQILSLGMTNGLFTGKKLRDYIDGAKCEYVQARRIINGTDKAAVIAAYAEKFEGLVK